ncbi:MAG: hypothetical protein ACWGON_09275 [Gemmatimonadota bacterium]
MIRQSAVRRLTGKRVLESILVLLATSSLVPATARAQQVEGQVISGRDSAAVPGAPVLMHRLTADTGEIVDSTSADARGRFSLGMVSGDDPATLYVVAALHDGVSYFGPALHPGAELDGPYTVIVYDTETITGPLKDSRIMLRHVVMSPTAHGLLQISEIVDVAGESDRALGTASPADPIWTMELPVGLQSWSPLQGGLPAEAINLNGNTLEVRAKLPPSGMRVAFSYFLEGPAVDLSNSHPTDRIEVMLVGAREDEVVGLRLGSSADLPPGSNARRFVATDVGAGDRIGLSLESESPTGRLPVLLWGGAGVAFLLAAGVSARLVGLRAG